MLQLGAYRFKQADSPEELEQVHRLNYQTFVREIPQHADTGTGQLIDKYHHKNHYLIAYKHNELVGMMAWCDEPPFSVASRLPDVSILDDPTRRLVEIRLLAVVPEERKSPVVAGLYWALYEETKRRGWTHFIISGIAEQEEMHNHLGFEPLGPPVGSGKATFTPKWLPVEKLEATMGRSMALWKRRLERTN